METNYSLSKMAVATLVLVIMAMVPAAVSVTYTVGETAGWDSGVDYTTWVTGKTFQEFIYGASHSMDVVNKTGYDACDGSSSTEKHSDGDTLIDLKRVGTKYFICPTPGHCASGMKLSVTVIASSSATPSLPSPLPGSPPPTPDSPSSPLPVSPPPPISDLPRSDGTHEANSGSTTRSSPPPPPPPSSGASSRLMSYVMVGISLVLALQCVMCG